ncbi:MAG TPA: DNA repair protein RadA [Bacteroidales bacterium]|nr:DNA repair protein RadA [Bacteroidales bacterium]
MAKSSSIYVCQSCGARSSTELGRCPVCGEWGSYVQEIVSKGPQPKTVRHDATGQSAVRNIRDVVYHEQSRLSTGMTEFDRVLGGGLVAGSMTLLGGEPGIGKSTLVLQMALRLNDIRTLYVSGEESIEQLKMRAERIGGNAEQCLVVSETNLERITEHIAATEPQIVIIDSIQTLTTDALDAPPGSISQVRQCATELTRYAKESRIPFIVIGHINKEGSIAGPKILEHIVDTVLQAEGDSHYMYRIVRAVKNRFGSTSEIGIFEMVGTGLREVTNPSELLLTQEHSGLSGVAVTATVEGIRPLLIEVQALVSSAAYGVAQRSCTGFDTRRLNMLLAVLEKRAGFKLAQKDVFLNIAGGLRISDPATDLAVCAAVLSSNLDMPIIHGTCMTAEVGLSGELRPVNRIEQRVKEAAKLGFQRIIVPHGAYLKQLKVNDIEIVAANRIDQAMRLMFKQQ